jgi:hypothetical protein
MSTTRPFGHTRLSRKPSSRYKGKKALTGEERVAEGLVYSRFFDTHAADRNTNGVDGLLETLEEKVSKFVSTRPQKLKPFSK